MSKPEGKKIVFPALALFLICLIAAALLAVTNEVTAEKIVQTEKAQAEASRKEVMPEAAEFGEEKSVSVNGKTVTYCEALDGSGTVIGYVFTGANKGYGGDVSVMTGIKTDGTVNKSVILAADDETPGLGQNAKKPDFLDQFIGQNGPFEWVKNGGEPEKGTVDGVSSATFTSKAVIESVNDALAAFEEVKGNG